MITTKTASRVMTRSLELMSIGDALYENGFREEAEVVHDAARKLAAAAASFEDKITRYARAARSNL